MVMKQESNMPEKDPIDANLFLNDQVFRKAMAVYHIRSIIDRDYNGKPRSPSGSIPRKKTELLQRSQLEHLPKIPTTVWIP